MDTLDAALDNAVGVPASQESGWRKLEFLRNPFPSRSHPIWDVFYGQEVVRKRFYDDLVVFLRDSTTTTLFFTGGNRVGKTHFMEYHRRELSRRLPERGLTVPVVVASAQSCDFWQLYIQMIEQVDDSLRAQAGAGLFEAEVPPAVAERLSELPSGDFRRAVERAWSARTTPQGSEPVRLLLRQWLRGERLRAAKREELGVSGLLDSQAEVMNAFEGLVKYLLLQEPSAATTAPGAERPSRCSGIVIFLDEFELVWKFRRDRRDQYLQALRALIDACPKGLFLSVGMATNTGVGTGEVETAYPALFQRLKGARSIPTLVQIGGVVEALGYARSFEEYGRREFRSRPGQGPAPQEGKQSLFSDREIEALFKELAGFIGSVAQGEFFDRLHLEAERKLQSHQEASR
ncbi:DUF2791 family P-loop domain-containing protein [Stigmatella sp. ncwal1]|uniref:DUF2791 family P-loop domain-containing protein n=1 Tax=Stigmatella ashevillensis TaxID=2995309 RepID=A0ABT5DG06_9BACT|nr:BREX system ATP-binding domain-containing protein [Stigmatella ashevillena]MDC0712538.1 DUF2791 family P-loop domain-containing protein [Stigmatella ashevillena]